MMQITISGTERLVQDAERRLRRAKGFPWLSLAMGLGVGIAMAILLPLPASGRGVAVQTILSLVLAALGLVVGWGLQHRMEVSAYRDLALAEAAGRLAGVPRLALWDAGGEGLVSATDEAHARALWPRPVPLMRRIPDDQMVEVEDPTYDRGDRIVRLAGQWAIEAGPGVLTRT